MRRPRDPYDEVPWWIADGYLVEAGRLMLAAVVVVVLLLIGCEFIRAAWDTLQAQSGR